jgi:hypothetical protein
MICKNDLSYPALYAPLQCDHDCDQIALPKATHKGMM